MQIPLLYILHSGQLYGTERLALSTLEGLKDQFQPILLAPPGPALEEAQRCGFETHGFTSSRTLATHLKEALTKYQQLACIATGVTHSLILLGLNLLYNRQLLHLHMVHGGTDERSSYGRKKYLNWLGTTFITNSSYTKSRMIANGVRDDLIKVIENFLPESYHSNITRTAFEQKGIERLIVVSRTDPIKRIDLLLEALERFPELSKLPVQVCGTGSELYQLRERAQRSHPNVTFLGFSSDIPKELASADLLVHLCPVEPFGIAIIEAMALGLPVLVPDTGGASTLVENGVSGFKFKANDADDLAKQLLILIQASPEQLNQVVAGAKKAVATRFSAARGVAEYRHLLNLLKY